MQVSVGLIIFLLNGHSITQSVIFVKSCMFEKKIREKSLEAVKKDHEFWLKKVRERKLIPEGGKKGAAEANFEVEKSTDINLERHSDEQNQHSQSNGEPALRSYTVKKVQEKVDVQIKAMSNLLKLTVSLLVVTVFLFLFTLILTTRRIHKLEDSVEQLTSLLTTGNATLRSIVNPGNSDL